MSVSVAIRKSFGDFTLDTTFEAPRGVTALFGPSGAGKTSLIRAIAGLMEPDTGRISVDGTVLFDRDAGINLDTARRDIGYVFQEPRLFPHLNVRRNLTYGGKGKDAGTLDEIVKILGLEPLLQRRPAGLSGGEQQRVAIGRALLRGPKLLLMDEPLASLDDARKDEVLGCLEQLRDRHGIPVIYVSHAISEIARLATSLVVIRDGRVAMSGPIEAVLSSAAAVPLLGARAAGGILTVTVHSAPDADGLSSLTLRDGQKLRLPSVGHALGTRLRLRIQAQDVILSRTRPEGLSALNILRGHVTDVQAGAGPGVAVTLMLGKDPLVVRITGYSAREMALGSGGEIYAILKSTAVPRADVSGGRASDPA